MIVNGKEYNIDDLIKSLDIDADKHEKVGSLMLTRREIDILERNFIDYKHASSLKDLMLLIENALEDDMDDESGNELDYVLENIAERDYYQNVIK